VSLAVQRSRQSVSSVNALLVASAGTNVQERVRRLILLPPTSLALQDTRLFSSRPNNYLILNRNVLVRHLILSFVFSLCQHSARVSSLPRHRNHVPCHDLHFPTSPPRMHFSTQRNENTFCRRITLHISASQPNPMHLTKRRSNHTALAPLNETLNPRHFRAAAGQ
jgi:hypothetical protein